MISTMKNRNIKILLISDSHENQEMITKLLHQLRLRKEVYDIIIHSGDFLFSHTSKSKKDNTLPLEEEVSESEVEVMKCLFNQLLEFSKYKKIYFIPGNHDPTFLFHPNSSSFFNEKFINIHNNVWLLSELFEDNSKNDNSLIKDNDKLYLIGIGGSSPTVLLDDSSSTSSFISFGSTFYGNTYKESEEKLYEFYINLRNRLSAKERFILVTHSGFFSHTSIKYRLEKLEKMGSYRMYDEIKNDESLIFHVHGHTHLSQGRFNYNNTSNSYSVNPGGLTNGLFADVLISIDDEDGEDRYVTKSLRFFNLG